MPKAKSFMMRDKTIDEPSEKPEPSEKNPTPESGGMLKDINAFPTPLASDANNNQPTFSSAAAIKPIDSTESNKPKKPVGINVNR